MSFTTFSSLGAALTFSRESENFDRMFSEGVYSGMQGYADSSSANYKLSIFGGYCVINGVLYYDDQDNTELLDLGSPVDATGDHHLIWLDVSGDTPTYSVKTGTYASPAALTGPEAEQGLKLCDVWMPNAASDIGDATISNVDRVQSNKELLELMTQRPVLTARKLKVTNSGNVYTFHCQELALHQFNSRKGVDEAYVTRFPFSKCDLSTGVTSTEFGAGFEISYDANGNDRYVVVYIKDDSDYAESYDAQTLQVFGYEDAVSFESGDDEQEDLTGNAPDPVTEVFPSRAMLHNNRIVAIIDTALNYVTVPGLISMPVDVEFENGAINQYVNSISSTAYGTGPVTRGGSGDIDIDGVLDNAARLHNGTLDTVYDGLENGVAAGSKVNMDSTTSGGDREVAYEAVTEDDNSNRMQLLARQHATINGKQCVLGSSTWVSDGAGGIATTQLGTITPSDAISMFGNVKDMSSVNAANDYSNYIYMKFDGSGSTHLDKMYILQFAGIAGGAGAWGVYDLDGTKAAAADFPALPFSEDVTLWEATGEISDTSRLKSVEVFNEVSGYEGLPATINRPRLKTSYDNMTDFSFTTAAGQIAMVSGDDEPPGTVSDFVSSAEFDHISTDGFYLYCLRNNGIGNKLSFIAYDFSGTIIGSFSTSNNAASASTGKVAGHDGRVAFIIYDNYVDIIDPRDGTTYVTVEDFGDTTKDLVVINQKCYVVGDRTSSINFREYDTTGATGVTANAGLSTNIEVIDAYAKQFYVFGATAANTKRIMSILNKDYLTTLYTDIDYDSDHLGRDVQVFDEVVDMSVSDKYIAMLFNDGTRVWIDILAKPEALNSGVNSPQVIYSHQLPWDGLLAKAEIEFGQDGTLFCLISTDGATPNGNIITAFNPDSMTPMWTYQLDTTKAITSICSNGQYLFFSEEIDQVIKKISIGVGTSLFKKTNTNDYKLIGRKV